jgi:hypothetical protein
MIIKSEYCVALRSLLSWGIYAKPQLHRLGGHAPSMRSQMSANDDQQPLKDEIADLERRLQHARSRLDAKSDGPIDAPAAGHDGPFPLCPFALD